MTNEVDTHDPAGMAAFLRERAKANREIAELPREQWPYRPAVLQHWAFRFEQAADLIERLDRKCAALAYLLYGKPPCTCVPMKPQDFTSMTVAERPDCPVHGSAVEPTGERDIEAQQDAALTTTREYGWGVESKSDRTHPGGSAIPVSTQVPTSAPDSTRSEPDWKHRAEEAERILSDSMALANRTTRRAMNERNAIIQELRKRYTAAEIADMVGLTRQRVHQILNERPVEGSVHGSAENRGTEP